MAVATYTKAGAKATTAAKLDSSVFGVEVKNHELVKLAYTAYLANGRENLAVVKTRGLVRGGGRKPWKQKGTGRARFGSSRNPIWRGGGIVFGPTGSENYTKKMPLTMKRAAIRQALTMAAQQNRITVIESLEAKDGKTVTIKKLLDKISAKGRVLLVNDVKDEALELAARNIQKLDIAPVKQLNVYVIVNADTIVITKKALDAVSAWLGGKK